MAETRRPDFRRNPALEKKIKQLGEILEPAEARLLDRYRHAGMRHPLILVMGPLRSGTTLFLQWLASSGLVAYPSNLLSRFFRSPIIGAEIQLLLTDARYRFRDELDGVATAFEFSSINGKTKGVLAPNEFWYFWRRFLPVADRDVWTDDELRQGMDAKTMRAEILGIMEIFDKPFAAKGMLFNYNIAFLNEVFEDILFVQIERDLIDNVGSVLDARQRQLGDQRAWYSFAIPEYEELADLEPVQQATGQVLAINRAVTLGIQGLPDSRKISLRYEAFCRDPGQIFEEITDRLHLAGKQYSGPRRFEISRLAEGPRAEAIRQALAVMAPRYSVRNA